MRLYLRSLVAEYISKKSMSYGLLTKETAIG